MGRRVVRKPMAFSCVMLGIALCVGCGRVKAPELARVTGTVTRNGKPVANLQVKFSPESGRPSWGLTDASGRYKLYYSRDADGARFGRHKVYVEFNTFQPQSFAGAGPAASNASQSLVVPAAIDLEARRDDEDLPVLPTADLSPEERRAIEEKYGNPATTPLQVEITKDGQVLDIALD